jgi:cytochrome b involved in lipid metabolism
MNDTTLPKPSEHRKYPRQRANKGAVVKPGFGLHDWMTLLGRAKDLAQRKGSPLRRDIPPSEVKLHDKPHDGWITLRGKVYNLSPYLAYHPGGDVILHSVLGKDATALFDKYHRWVNVDNLIGPLLLGTLRIEKRGSSTPEDVGPLKDDEDEEDGEDGDENELVASASTSQNINGHGSRAMPKPKPANGEPAACLLPPRRDDDDDDDDETDEYSTKM